MSSALLNYLVIRSPVMLFPAVTKGRKINVL